MLFSVFVKDSGFSALAVVLLVRNLFCNLLILM